MIENKHVEQEQQIEIEESDPEKVEDDDDNLDANQSSDENLEDDLSEETIGQKRKNDE